MPRYKNADERCHLRQG